MFFVAVATILTAVVYGASILHYRGHVWADAVCTVAAPVCAAPHWVALATVAIALIHLFRQSVQSSRI
jgi:hypothetical protein